MKKILLLATTALLLLACKKDNEEPEPEPEYYTVTVIVDIAENVSWNASALKYSYTLVNAEFSLQQVSIEQYNPNRTYGIENKWVTTENPSTFVFNRIPKSRYGFAIKSFFSVRDKDGKLQDYNYHFNRGPTMFYINSDTTIYIARTKGQY